MKRNKTSNLYTAWLLLAGVVHLSAFGLVDYGSKWIGDLILSSMVALALINGKLVPPKGSPRRPAFFWAAIFLAYCFWILIFSFIQYGQIYPPIQWGRRWFAIGLYLLIVHSELVNILNPRWLHKALIWGGIFVGFLAIALEAGKVNLAGAYIIVYDQSQGGVRVEKFNLPGICTALIATILAGCYVISRPSPKTLRAWLCC